MARYKEIMDDIKKTVRDRTLSFGDRLPSEREFIEKYHVSSKTLKYALRELQFQGVLFQQNGRGTFVGKASLGIGTLAFLLPNMIRTGYNHEVIERAEIECSKKQINFMYMTTNNSYEKTIVHINNLESVDLDAIVFTPLVGKDAKHNKNLINMLKKKTGQLILLDSRIPNKNSYSYVGNENIGSSFKLTELLIKNKYNFYMFIANTDNSTVHERRKGFMDAMTSYGIPEERIKEVYLPPAGKNHVDEKIAGAVKKYGSVGIFVINDVQANDLVRKLSEMEYLIPKEVGVAGFGGVSLQGPLPLTTAKIDFSRIAREIIRLTNTNDNRTVIIPTKIIRGKTT